MSNLQFSTIKAIAKAGVVKKPLSKDFIQTYNLGAASSVQGALNMLLNKEMVVKDEEGFMVHDILLSRWLQRL